MSHHDDERDRDEPAAQAPGPPAGEPGEASEPVIPEAPPAEANAEPGATPTTAGSALPPRPVSEPGTTRDTLQDALAHAHEPHGISRKGPLAYMAQNSVAANLIMILLLLGGALMVGSIKQEVFPEVTADVVNISVVYPGASPEEVEEGVVLAIEDAVRGLDGIKEVTSTASEGVANVTIELLSNADQQKALDEVQNAVDRITSFPVEIERPTISQPSTRRQVVSLIYYGDASEKALRELAEQSREQLVAQEGITLVELSSVRRPEISIEIPEANLRKYGLTIDQVSQRVSAASIDLPGGGVKTEGGEILVRTTERREVGSEFADIVVLSRPDGTDVRLGEIATVLDEFEETDQAAYFNGQRAVRVEVYRVGDQTPLDIARAVKAYVAEETWELPEGVDVVVWQDDSEIYRDRIDLLLRNGYTGLLLVLVVLGVFLELRLAFWVTMGIPISFLGTMFFMPVMGVSLNMISLFAFILTLGIVVDDAIVVGEAVYKHRQEGMGPLDAAISGVREVAMPVVFSILTTVVAFMPLLFVPGTMGKFFYVIPAIVIIVLLLSLVESLFVLPAHLAHIKGKPRGVIGFVFRLQEGFANLIERGIDRFYTPVLRLSIWARYATFAVAVAILVAMGGFVSGGHVPFTFMPKVEGDSVNVSLRMPFGTPVESTRDVVARLEETAAATLRELGSEDDLRGLFAQVGAATAGGGPAGTATSSGSHIGQVQLYLVPSDERTFTTEQFVGVWREKVGEVAGVENLTYTFNIGPSGGSAIDVELSHRDPETLEAAAERLARSLERYGGVFDIDNGVSRGKEQLDLTLTPSARALGLTEQDLARQLRGSFFGSEAVRQQRGRDEVRVFVRRPLSERSSMADIETMLVYTPDGGEIPLRLAADIEVGRSYTSIERKDGRRVLHVTADVDTKVTTANEVVASLQANELPTLLADVPNLQYAMGGEQEDQAESLGALGEFYVLAMIAMFALMAIAFKSYVQPIIVMLAIPFGIIGALGGHIIMGYGLSLISMMGIIALSGVVVNDSLVLISAINDYRADGMTARDAVIRAGARRFRPILLTTLTTFFGLLPMISETSVQARFLIPMAISLGFGVLFTTFVILVIVPSVYLIIEDARRLAFRARVYIWGEPAHVPTGGAPPPRIKGKRIGESS